MFCLGKPVEIFFIIIPIKGWHILRWKQAILFQVKQSISGKCITGADICFTKPLVHSCSLWFDPTLHTTLKTHVLQALDPTFFQLHVSHPSLSELVGCVLTQVGLTSDGWVGSDSCSAGVQAFWKELVIFI